MGAKTALLAFTDGDLRPALLGATRCDPAEAEELVRTVHPCLDVVHAEDDGTLFDDCYPQDGLTFATVLAGAELVCDQKLLVDPPSKLPEHLHALGAGRRIIMHGMHSVVDWLCFAVWEDGVLVRSLSLSPDTGIQENIGEPFDFERPYWAGEHPVESSGDEDEDPYPLPFHPLDLGEVALSALFGFTIEGQGPDPDELDPESVHLYGFRITGPSGTG